jgi:hypothetical protein
MHQEIQKNSSGFLKIKQKQKEETMHIEDTERLVTEIEMLKVVLYLVARDKRRLD